MNNKKWLIVALVSLFFIYLIVFQLIAIWPFTLDDSYISLRYAKNWTVGHGLVWNIGEPPVEGYSNFSFVVLASLAIHLGFDPLIMLKAMGALGLILSTIAVYYLTRFWFSICLSFIPCFWLLLYRGEIIWSVTGLETTIYQALVSFSLVFLLRGMGYRFYAQTRKRPSLLFFMLAGFLLALAGLTRPEAPALMLLFAGLAFIDSPRVGKKAYYKDLVLGCLVCLVIFVPYFLWRWTYYGQLFPNPVYCKGFMSFFAVMDKHYLRLALPFILLALVAIVKAKDRRHYFFWLPNLLYLILLIDADPVSAFENRLFLPVFILLLPLAFLGLSQIWTYIFPQKDSVYEISLLISVVLIAFFFIPTYNLANYRSFTINPQAGIRLRQQVVEWLNENIPPHSQVVLADSGLIPYSSSLAFIDSYCLNNKTMTRLPLKDMYERLCNEILMTKPKVLILTSYIGKDGEVIYTPTDLCLHRQLKHDKSYQFRTAFELDTKLHLYRYEIYTLLN
ncbi:MULTISPECIES: hypothetical protein [Legionella]|uniref:LphB n=1 Tax=Legionella drozanskii LLAP-1 TaxID=1212489 RepID=A0A0W0SQA0_9GAMM|nr:MULTISPECIES: hypothetical protein [Legionella]KTC85594.1 LphB [Legionella drozanskii LLAP-1]PJE15808.1 MAG: protein LphB [Legionella sp.]